MKKMNTAIRCTGIVLLVFLLSLSLPAVSQGAMNDYCVAPPFIVGGVTPNLLLMIDNSASMYDLTYISPDGYYCYDNSYDDTALYVGYFDSAKFYTSAGTPFALDGDGSTFAEHAGGFPPAGCTYRTAYLCVSLAGTDPDNVTQFVVKGNFLNWLSASKMDIQKEILTGGKYDTVSSLLTGEARGCVGKTFVKQIPDADWIARPVGQNIAFGVRGPRTDPQLPSTGGTTRIDIYKGNYDWSICQQAIDLWQEGSFGQAKQATADCLLESAGSKGKKDEPAFNHALQSCWTLFRGQALDNGDIQRIQNACELIYIKEGIDPTTITPDNKAYVCVKDPAIIDPTDPTDPGGYVGICWKDAATKWQGVPVTVTIDECIERELTDFCLGIQIGEVVDPSQGAVSTDEAWNIPAFLAEASIKSQLGDPVRTYQNRIDSVEPTGLLQEFGDLIRFGAMTFNDYGSPTECVMPDSHITYTCNEPTNKDAGRVIHHIGYVGAVADKSVGDHSSGLISTIDNIDAETWTPFAEGFYNAIGYFAIDPLTGGPGTGNSRIDLRIDPGDFDETKNPVQYRCQKNNVLIISDGMSTADLHPAPNNLAQTYNPLGDNDGEFDIAVGVCPKYAGSRNLDDLAWLAKNRNIQNFAQLPSENSHTITTHVVFSGVPTIEVEPVGQLECDPDELMRQTATNGGGEYSRAENPEALREALRDAFLMISGKAASGTAASVLASGEGTGANLVQAIFYPERSVGGTEIMWTGSLKNLWYHIDPLLGNSSIREDKDPRDFALRLDIDRIINFWFDPDENLTKAKLFRDDNADGVADTPPDSPDQEVYFEYVSSLWEAGARLWVKNADDRTIFTTTDGSTETAFTAANAATLKDSLYATTNEEASRIISYTRGYDKFCSVTITQPCDILPCPLGETCVSLRSRMVRHDLNGDGDTSDIIDGINEDIPRVWKLGDIINSTPRIVSWVPLNAYDKTYSDDKYEEFTESADYIDRGMVLVGANDGMLHAFELGVLTLYEERYKKAELDDKAGTIVLGDEKWAFIPRGALPYLKYMADPAYCHLYFVDLTPYVFDASIGSGGCALANYEDCPKTADTWKTIVIGGMRMGGACKDPTDSDINGIADACTVDLNGDGLSNEDCVLTPVSGEGYSSYFALDITDTSNPVLLWEFSNEGLGYSTTGPAVVRISALKDGNPDNTKNGKWFVVFGSGPTGPIDTATYQFKGYSDQPLKLFILDLKSGNLLRTINTLIPYAFAGSLSEASIDFHQNDRSDPSFYQDDALYLGFVKAENDPPIAGTKWNVGGVLRLFTKNSLNPDPDWEWSPVIENIGPVTGAVKKLQNYDDHRVFLFFGTGRFYFRISDNIDDAASLQYLYGVREPCYDTVAVPDDIDFGCSDVAGGLTEAATGAGTNDPDGWYILLDGCTNDDGGPVGCGEASPPLMFTTERSVTDPLATPIGAVFFTTTKPSADVCEFGGTSHLWAVDWDTGGAVPSSVLRGKAIMQVSTGSIEEVDLKTEFTEKGGRRTSAFQGVPPAGSPPGILIPPKPQNKFIHIFEK